MAFARFCFCKNNKRTITREICIDIGAVTQMDGRH
jgi:hypothetical protein